MLLYVSTLHLFILANSFPLYGRNTFCLSIHHLIGLFSLFGILGFEMHPNPKCLVTAAMCIKNFVATSRLNEKSTFNNLLCLSLGRQLETVACIKSIITQMTKRCLLILNEADTFL